MSYLILGSNSFAGGSLVNLLLSNGEKVIGISRSSETHPVLRPYYCNSNINDYNFIQLDINKDLTSLIALINKHKPKYIVDFAGQGMVAESWVNSEQWYQTNIISKVKLHDFLKNCDFMERYIRVSTPEVYGSTSGTVDETFLYNPSTPYAVSHAAVDMSLKAFYNQYQFPVIITRFANFYGAHQQLYRIIPRTIIYALLGKKLLLQGGGHSKRAFIHGCDVAEGIKSTIDKGSVGEVYHFSSGKIIAIRELVEKICGAINIEFTSLVELVEDRPGKDAYYDMDSNKALKNLGWKPKYTLDRGIDESVSWVKNNIEAIKELPLNYIHKA
jgi:dTDP-glucose 4,6-dehydratase